MSNNSAVVTIVVVVVIVGALIAAAFYYNQPGYNSTAYPAGTSETQNVYTTGATPTSTTAPATGGSSGY